MGCVFHCWLAGHGCAACCDCGAVPGDGDRKITFWKRFTMTRDEIRGHAKDACVLCGGSGLVGERERVCECVDPTDITFGMS